MGNYKCYSTIFIEGIIQLETLEALACREAFTLAEDLYLSRIHIVTYCLATEKHIHGEYRGTSAMVISDIRANMANLREVRVMHEARDSIYEAQDPAKAAVSLNPGRMCAC